MKKIVIFLVIFSLVAAAAALAQEAKLKDVPDKHWAAGAVYDLVKLGVTKGYPDGTFRGSKNITRYETAVFLHKLANAIRAGSLKEDLEALKGDVAALRKSKAGTPLSGSYSAGFKFGNLLAQAGSTRGAVAPYRLKLSSAHNLGNDANVVVNLDTMDYGFSDDGTTTTGGKLATELLDIESKVRVNLTALGLEKPVELKLTVGPGPQQHSADASGVLASDVGVTYLRPDTGILASAALWGMDVAAGYYAINLASSGRVATSKITGALGYSFDNVPLVNTVRLDVSGDYISSGMYSSSSRDMRASLALTAPLAAKVDAAGTIGLAGSKSQNLMLAGALTLKDLWDTGTVANIRVSKIGADFISSAFAADEFDYAGLDTFSRPFENSTVNFGGELVQSVAPDIQFVGKGDLRLNSDGGYKAAKGRLTAQGGILYAIAPNTTLDASYRLHEDKTTNDTSDITSVGLMYQF